MTEPKPNARENGDKSAVPPVAKVQKVGDWHLVTCGSWQISVAPDALLMLPRHLHPNEVAEFVACAMAAADVGTHVLAANNAKATGNLGHGLPSRRAIVAQGPPPPGAVRMPIAQRSTIGQPKRRNAVAAAIQQHTPNRSTS